MTFDVAKKGVGLPDYSQPAPLGMLSENNIYTTTDVGELAARMGSPSVFDRRGNVIFSDSFESGIESFTFSLGAGAGAVKDWVATKAATGGFCLKVAGGIATTTDMYHYWGTDTPGRIGGETSLAADASSLFGYFQMYLAYEDGASYHLAGIIYDLSADALYLYTDSGNVLIASDVLPDWTNGSFNSFKLVWNSTTDTYERVIVNQSEIDITQYMSPKTAVVASKYSAVLMKFTGGAATAGITYVDNVLVTKNEPVND